MARILIVCTGLKSSLFATVALATRLRDSGHDVAFAAQDESRRWLDHAGFRVIAVPDARMGWLTAFAPAPRSRRRALSERRGRASAAADILLRDGIARALAEAEPDVVLCEIEHHSGVVQSVAAGVPTGILCPMYYMPRSADAPPLFSEIVPGRGWRGSRIGMAAKWAQFQTATFLSLVRHGLRFWGADYATAHFELARRLGLRLAPLVTFNSALKPWAYRLPTLYLLPGELDLAPRPPRGHVFAGPMVLRDRPETDTPPECRRFASTEAGARIFVSFGTLRKPPPGFLDKLVEVARRNPAWAMLIAAPRSDGPEAPTLPPNLGWTDWAPQLDMLGAADCAIFHGGVSTMIECCVTATPMLIYPNGFDGGGNAARAVFHGLGETGGFGDPVEKIEADIREILENPRYRMRLDETAAGFDRYAGVAERFVDDLLHRGQA